LPLAEHEWFKELVTRQGQYTWISVSSFSCDWKPLSGFQCWCNWTQPTKATCFF